MSKIKLYIINLKRSTDRYRSMREKITALLDSNPDLCEVLEFEFFEAIDGKAGEHKRFSDYYSKRLCLWLRGKELSDGEIACFASHYTLWQKCVSESKPCIIIEDDVLFSEHFAQGVLEILRSGYEYVRFIQTRPLRSSKPTDLPHIFATTQLCAGTQGYYLTPSAAHRFIAYAKKWIFPVDDYMDMFYIHKVWILVCVPHLLASNETLETNIADRNTLKPSRATKITREIVRLALQVHKAIFCLTHYRARDRLCKKLGSSQADTSHTTRDTQEQSSHILPPPQC
ncbi:glycosyltransferase family 25 protein [uncultured Helicobacter sp.]|uniref:glycosyltransferase family 25 protein n=1 Tax=uncultured Helicobacter sp. TaxID=175537 RepID=UPI00374EFB89